MIYFVRCQSYIKVGYTKDLEERLKAASTFNPMALEVVKTIEGEIVDEKRIHKELSKFRYKGEWFHDCKEVNEYIDKQTPTQRDYTLPKVKWKLTGRRQEEILMKLIRHLPAGSNIITITGELKKQWRTELATSINIVEGRITKLVEAKFLEYIEQDHYKVLKLRTLEKINERYSDGTPIRTTLKATFHAQGEDYTIEDSIFSR